MTASITLYGFIDMNHDYFSDLIRLADALTFISENEYLWKLVKDAGYQIADFDIYNLILVVADEIRSQLIS